MKTKTLIENLRYLSKHPERAKDYGTILRISADRLEELSTGKLYESAENLTKIYTIHEMALMLEHNID